MDTNAPVQCRNKGVAKEAPATGATGFGAQKKDTDPIEIFTWFLFFLAILLFLTLLSPRSYKAKSSANP